MNLNLASLKQNRWVRRGVIALVSLLVLWVVLWLAVPPIAKSQLQKIASEKLGRQVTVGKIDFKPWTLELALHDLSIAGPQEGAPPQLQIGRLYADAELQSLFRLAPVIDAISVESPAVRITHTADGKYDFDDILAKLASAPEEPKGDPVRFALYNIAISNGSVDFDDKTVGRKHELRNFALNVPFLSSLASKRDVNVEPKLAFTLNGSHFDSSAQSTPFADNRKTAAQLRLDGLDLGPYLGYIPSGLPVKLLAGTLDADLKIDFEQAQTAGLKITGTLGARDTKLADAQGGDLLSFGALKLNLADVRPLERVVHLSEISLTGPNLAVARDAAGRLNLLPPEPAPGAAKKDAAAKPPAAAASAPEKAQEAESPALRLQVDKFVLNDGKVGWRDDTLKPAAAIEAGQLQVEVSGIAWPMEKPAQFGGSMALGGGSLKFKGQGTDKEATVETELDAVPLSLGAAYVAQTLEPTLDGKLGGQLEVAWAQPGLKVKVRKLQADALALAQGKTSLASVGRIELTETEADLAKKQVAVGGLSVTNPKLSVERDADKRWMYERWLKVKAAATKPAAPAPEKPAKGGASPAAPEWALTLGTLVVDGGAVSYSDKAGSSPVEVEISALKLQAQKIAPNTATSSPIQVSGRIAADRRIEPGRFDYKGNLALAPLSTDGRLELASIPVHPFKAHFSDLVNIDIRRLYANYRGTLRFANPPSGMQLKVAGDTAIDDMRANSATLTQAAGSEARGSRLLSWKTLSLRGLQVAMEPGAPIKVDVRETSLTDFFARVILEESGRLNLQSLTKSGQEKSAAAAADAATKRSGGATTTTSKAPVATARGGAPVSAEEMVGGAAPAPAPAQPASAPVAAAPAADTASGPAPIINFGPISLVNGRIDFTDLFIKPNYSADLSELTGKLSAFSSQPKAGQPTLADLELRGKAQQTAALEITGKLNPLVKPLELDITAKMRDLDLPPLSPYTVRYAGHGIERGKLSVDVNYKITPDGRLAATNKIVLNQLLFGDEVKGAPASLPVRLAVALLADRNGVIDVDFPLSGSINDPQFSVGPLIIKAIVNLVAKAVTAPFALLTGGLGGGSGESSTVVFDAGSAAISDGAKPGLDKVAKALADRDGLRLTVIGTADLEKEREGFKRQRVRQMAQAEKRRAAVRAGKNAAEVGPVTDAEYPELLAAVYKRADITKPRNMIGLAKDLPTKEMEDLLLASIKVEESAIRELAVERGAAVRDYLLAHKLSSERIFLGAVRLGASGNDWKPGAELKLEMR